MKGISAALVIFLCLSVPTAAVAQVADKEANKRNSVLVSAKYLLSPQQYGEFELRGVETEVGYIRRNKQIFSGNAMFLTGEGSFFDFTFGLPRNYNTHRVCAYGGGVNVVPYVISVKDDLYKFAFVPGINAGWWRYEKGSVQWSIWDNANQTLIEDGPLYYYKETYFGGPDIRLMFGYGGTLYIDLSYKLQFGRRNKDNFDGHNFSVRDIWAAGLTVLVGKR